MQDDRKYAFSKNYQKIILWVIGLFLMITQAFLLLLKKDLSIIKIYLWKKDIQEIFELSRKLNK